ncbi:MAG TPA: Ig-like domain-containing protein [Sporichthyaceae bacterium]|nr:Ig-like domain-containing protein [Sporichthyaceae bacterium]
MTHPRQRYVRATAGASVRRTAFWGGPVRPTNAVSPITTGDAIKGSQPRSARLRLLALATAGPLLLAGCGATAAASGPSVPAQPAGPPKATVVITPTDGTTQIAPGARVTVTSVGGTLQHVDLVTAGGAYLSGAYNADRTSWSSANMLAGGQTYAVDATATNAAGLPTEDHAGFSTAPVPASQRLAIASVTPSDGATFGVAYPLVVTFTKPVQNRQAVSAALDVETLPHVDGAWYWIDTQTVDYRPQSFWPTGTVVTLHSNLAGIDAGNGLWGTSNTTSSFTVARSEIINVNLKTDKMTIVRDGKKIGSYDVSGGKPGWQTRDGTMTIMEKVTDKIWTNTAIDAPEPYRLESNYAMRITDSGEFIHDAPWNVGNITSGVNASHGCVGMLTSNMAVLFDESMVGDPVIITGSPRSFGALTNRIADWNVPWAKWLGGNYDLSYR